MSFHLLNNLKLLQLNTGNGFCKKSQETLLNIINTSKSSIIFVSESNSQLDKPVIMSKQKRLFNEFNIEDKAWVGYNLSRVSFYIRKNIQYKRRTDLENNINSTIVIEVKRSKGQRVFIIGSYLQWRGKSPLCPYNEYDNHHAILRLRDLITLWERVVKLGQTVLMGDLNIDYHTPNDPSSRVELKDLIPMMDDFIQNDRMCQLNFEPT